MAIVCPKCLQYDKIERIPGIVLHDSGKEEGVTSILGVGWVGGKPAPVVAGGVSSRVITSDLARMLAKPVEPQKPAGDPSEVILTVFFLCGICLIPISINAIKDNNWLILLGVVGTLHKLPLVFFSFYLYNTLIHKRNNQWEVNDDYAKKTPIFFKYWNIVDNILCNSTVYSIANTYFDTLTNYASMPGNNSGHTR